MGAQPQSLVTVIEPDSNSFGPIQWLSESVIVTCTMVIGRSGLSIFLVYLAWNDGWAKLQSAVHSGSKSMFSPSRFRAAVSYRADS
jgi:hypothetical protein